MTQEEFEKYENLTADEQMEFIAGMGQDEVCLLSCELTVYRIRAAQRRHASIDTMSANALFAAYLKDMKFVLPFASDYAEQILEGTRKRIAAESASLSKA